MALVLGLAVQRATIAVCAWVPVMEDSADVGLRISCLALDTTHFASPTLLVGTYRDSSGYSVLMTVDPAALAPIDTIYRSTFVPNVCRAADLNGDPYVDFLISLTSVAGDSVRFSSLVELYGPSLQTADTLPLPRAASDLLVDEDRQAVWLGYRHDTTTSLNYGGCVEYHSQYIGFGGAFTYGLDSIQTLDGGGAAVVFGRADINADAVEDLVALRALSGSYWSVGCGAAPYGSWSAVGVWEVDGASAVVSAQQWIGFQSFLDPMDDIQPFPQLLLSDFDANGKAEAVATWQWQKRLGTYPLEQHTSAGAVSLDSGALLWSLTQPDNSPYTVLLYDLGLDGTSEVLLVGRNSSFGSGYAIHAFRGLSGDSLFTAGFRAVSFLNATYSPRPGVPQRVIHAAGDWLYRWRVDLGTSSEGNSELVIPNRFSLGTNAPNPFNTGTQVSYTLAYPMAINLTVYDALGRRVATLVDSHQSGGDHTVVWDGNNSAGQKAPSGVYFLRLSAEGDQLVRKMAVLK
jgi:hypothetical protein